MCLLTPQYQTAPKLTPSNMILRGVKFRAVSYCAELSPQILLPDSAQYHTAGNLTLRSMTPRGTLEKFEYLGENEIKNKTILTHKSVMKKTGGRKSRWTVPLNITTLLFMLPFIPLI